jgi:hypothetical protein
MGDALIALGMVLAVFALLYGGARFMGNGRCWRCRKLCPPWSVYCRRCLDGPEA